MRPVEADATDATSADGLSGCGSLALLTRAQAGDPQALDDLIRRYLPRLKKWVSGRLPSGHRGLVDTDDLVQETLINVVRLLPSFEVRHEAGLQAYFRQAVLNRLRDGVRTNAGRRHVGIDKDLAVEQPSALELAIGRQALERYERALQKLDNDERSAVVGRLEFGYTYGELALMLNRRTPDAARKLVERALPRLAEWMRDGR